MPNTSPDSLPEWDSVLSSAAHLQRILPGAVLVGGTAAYKRLDPKWQDWESVKTLCGALAVKLLDHFPS